MKCQHCQELLSQYIDGRLALDEASEVSAHIESCADCRAFEGELRATIALVASAERKAPPAGLAERVAARLERRLLLAEPDVRRQRRVMTMWRFTGVGAAAAAMLLAALYVCISTENTAVRDFALRGADETARAAQPADAEKAGAPAALELRRTPVSAPADERFGMAITAQPKSQEQLDRKAGLSTVTQPAPQAQLPEAPATTLAIRDDLKERKTEVGVAETEGRQRSAGDGAEREFALSKLRADVDKPVAATGDVREEVARAQTAGRAGGSGGGGAGGEELAAAKAAEPSKDLTRLGYVESPKPAAVAGGISNGPKEVAAQEAESRFHQLNGRALGEVPSVEFRFEGKITDAALEFLKLLPGDKETLPSGDVSLEALKTAAAARKVKVLELSADRAVLEYSAAPKAANDIVAKLSAGKFFFGVSDTKIESFYDIAAREDVAGEAPTIRRLVLTRKPSE